MAASRSKAPLTAASTKPGIGGAVLLDTGILVALHARDDPKHAAVTRWLSDFRGELHTVEPVLAEVAYFLPVRLRSVIAELVSGGAVTLHHPGAAGQARMAELFRKYADQDPDWADVALVWLAESSGIHRIATVDVADFNVYRIHGRKRFELELLA
ncbi:MAG: PIN domain-containing protein [Proteobacteria bacterium]|nr:PIN domain-containing protein [Pseudomonadota bacterium]